MPNPDPDPDPDPGSGDGPNRAALLDLAVTAARAAGRLLSDGLDRVRLEVDTKSSPTDMVTEMDRASEALITDLIHRARPDDGILGEEGTGSGLAGRSGVRWIVDPLDGTTNYLYGIAAFCVSIAAELDGTVVAAAVFDPQHDELFTATLDGGAKRNGQPLTRAAPPALSTALVGTGFSYQPDIRAQQAAVLQTVLPRVRDIRRGGSAALDLCSAALGRLDAFYEYGLQPWDAAAGSLIAQEACLEVSTLGGGATIADTIVAAPPALAGPLRDLLRAAGAESLATGPE